MLITCSLKDVKKYETLADKKYFAVLHPGKVKLYGFLHMPELAPSQELWSWAMSHKKETDWFEFYAKQFINDIGSRPGLRDAINRLEKEALEMNVLVVCFCPDMECHRILIAKELERRGVEVQMH